MLGSYCYSVTCNNQRTCQTIPAKPSYLKPKVAYLAWTQEPIEEDTSEKYVLTFLCYILFFIYVVHTILIKISLLSVAKENL